MNYYHVYDAQRDAFLFGERAGWGYKDADRIEIWAFRYARSGTVAPSPPR